MLKLLCIRKHKIIDGEEKTYKNYYLCNGNFRIAVKPTFREGYRIIDMFVEEGDNE